MLKTKPRNTSQRGTVFLAFLPKANSSLPDRIATVSENLEQVMPDTPLNSAATLSPGKTCFWNRFTFKSRRNL